MILLREFRLYIKQKYFIHVKLADCVHYIVLCWRIYLFLNNICFTINHDALPLHEKYVSIHTYTHLSSHTLNGDRGEGGKEGEKKREQK